MRATHGECRLSAGIALVAVLILAAALRIQGLAFGLPAVYNQDEVAIMSRTLAFAKGDLNPHNFLYPTFYFYALFGWLGAYFVGARALGVMPSLAAFETQFFVNPSGVYLAGRALGVACGVATVLVVYRLARRAGGRTTALIAALFLAVAPIAVRDAHYVKHDVPATLAVVTAYLAMWHAWRADQREGATRRWLWAGAACGVAFSTHYYTLFLVFPLALAILFGARGDRAALARHAALSGASAAVVFVALSPFLLVETRTAWHDMVANRQIVVDRAGGATGAWLPSARAYAGMLWREAVGWPVLLLGLVGAASLLRRDWRTGAWLLAFPLPFLAFISNTVAATRYMNPAIPFVAILAAVPLGLLAGSANRGGPSPIPRRPALRAAAAATALSLLAAWPGLRLSSATGRFFGQDDTRTLAQRFIESRVPAGSTVLVQPYSVQLAQSREGLVEALTANVGGPDRATVKFTRRLALDPYPAPAFRTLYLGDGGLDADKIYVSPSAFEGGTLDPLRRLDVQYVVLKRYNVADPALRHFVVALEREAALIARFSPYWPDAGPATREAVAPFLHNTDTPIDAALERPGPVVEVWALIPPGPPDPR